MAKILFRQVWQKSKYNSQIVSKKIEEVIQALPDRADVEIIVNRYTRPRSLNANSYYWMGLKMVSDFIGIESDILHEICKKKFLLKEAVNESTGEVFTYVGSTTGLDSLEFEKYRERCWIWFQTEFNYTVPPPNTILKIIF